MDDSLIVSIIKPGTPVEVAGMPDDIRPIVSDVSIYGDGSIMYNTILHRSDGSIITNNYNSSQFIGTYKKVSVISNLVRDCEERVPKKESLPTSGSIRRMPLAYASDDEYTVMDTDYPFLVGQRLSAIMVLASTPSDDDCVVYKYENRISIGKFFKLKPYLVRVAMKLIGRGDDFRSNAVYTETDEDFRKRVLEVYKEVSIGEDGQLQYIDIDLSKSCVVGYL